MIKKHGGRGETSILAISVARRSSPAACVGCSSLYGFPLAVRRAFRQTSVCLLHFAEHFAKRRFGSCNSRSVSPNVEVSPASCLGLSSNVEVSPASCLGLSPLGEDPLQLAGDVRTPTKYLLQSAGDVRTPTKYLLQLAGDVRSPTMIPCNLREMFVALQ